MQALINLWCRYKFLRAYKKDILARSGSLSARLELVARFNAKRFFWQKRIEIL